MTKKMTKKEKAKQLLNIMLLAGPDATELCNQLMLDLENLLDFENEEEHERWLDVATTYKFYEDFEELTLNIASR